MKFLTSFLTFLVCVSYATPVLAAPVVSDMTNPFWTQGIHCPEIGDSALKFGMQDTRTDTRISDLQLFFADYFSLPKESIVTGKFDSTTKQYLEKLHAEAGLKQSVVNGETRGIVNPRCGDAGIRPSITDFSVFPSNTVRKGKEAFITLGVKNTDYCRIISFSDVTSKDLKEVASFTMKRSDEETSITLAINPRKTTVYEVFCSYTYTRSQYQTDGTTQSMASLIVTAK